MSQSPLSPKLIKGAFIEFSNRFISSIPNVIIFQYNPETMTRKLEPWNEGDSNQEKSVSEGATAQPFDPEESMDLKLILDATDALSGLSLDHHLNIISGVAARLSALEVLLYPQEEATAMGLLGSVIASLGAAGGGFGGGLVSGGVGLAVGAGAALGGGLIGKDVTEINVPRGTVPMVLFAWGPGRIVPVRITSFSIEEQAYSPTLYPIRATVSISLKIIAPKNIPCSKKEGDKKAIAAYNIYQRQKKGMAAANMALNNTQYIYDEIKSAFD